MTKRYGDLVAVRDLDLAVPRGATYGFLGPNGAGKTTTIRILLRILEADEGEVRLLGEDPRREILDKVGYLPEERGLYRRMRVRDLLEFLAELKGLKPRVSRPRIDNWLERFDLADRAADRVQDLSKGMQQKLQFIAAVLHEPELVVLDEPFGGLDPLNQRILREVVADLQRAGRTVLFSTHLIEHAERLCDHVCIIAHGRKILDGPLARIRHEHGGSHVALGLDGGSLDDLSATIEGVRRAPMVARAAADGTEVEVALREGRRPQELLAWLVAENIPVRRFERVEASLTQIFIDRVGVDPTVEDDQED
ncbi:MAG TPA: ATP-binding cassette domain-containing protein [Gemmatimonadota bacterium]|nr:ATP-binding cassette domain-containing protein [Gemmatimonadota bacterium]